MEFLLEAWTADQMLLGHLFCQKCSLAPLPSLVNGDQSGFSSGFVDGLNLRCYVYYYVVGIFVQNIREVSLNEDLDKSYKL